VSARFWLGTSSWNYKQWAGVFYASGVDPADMLAQYARVFNSVEIDSSFYGIPRATSVERWRQSVGEDFRFSLKAPSAITHERRFVNADRAFGIFLDRVRPLGSRLGVVLLQCPPDFRPTSENREALFGFLETETPQDVRIALELRDPRWFDDDLFAQARAVKASLALTDGIHSDLALVSRMAEAIIDDKPTDYAYIRWLGHQTLPRYDRVQLDRQGSLDAWERIIRRVATVCSDVYGYASNDYEGFAPATIRGMLARLGLPPPPETGELRLF